MRWCWDLQQAGKRRSTCGRTAYCPQWHCAEAEALSFNIVELCKAWQQPSTVAQLLPEAADRLPKQCYS